MKKTTYSKSFTGYLGAKKTARGVLTESVSSELFMFPYEKKGVCEYYERGKPTKVRVTYTVTVEPVK